MAVLDSDIKALMKEVMSSTMKTVSAAQKTVISPTEVRNITKEILADFESGSIDKFLRALDRSEKIFDKLGLNIKEFNTGLAKRIDQLKEQRDKSAKQVEELRKRNIIAETDLNKKSKAMNIEVRILTKQEIDARKKQLKAEIKRVDDFERDILVKREKILEKETKDGFISRADQKDILKDEKKLADDRAKIEKEQQTLNPLADQGVDRGPQSQFFEELKAPFVAFGDALMAVRDGAMEAYNVFLFFKKGGLTSLLKGFAKNLKVVGAFFKSTRVLIGLAVAGVVGAIFFFRDKLGAVADFLVSIPEKIGNFFKKAFTTFTDFFKSAVNAVIMLVRKIPGFGDFGTLMETSKMKEEREEKERAERIKQGEKDFDSIGTETGFETTETGLMKPKFDFDKGQAYDDTDMANQSSVVFDPNTGQAKILNRQVVGDRFIGAGGDGQGDASVAKTLFQEQKQTSMFDTGEVPSAVVYNNQNTNVGGSNQTITGFITNKNVDNTFINLSNATP